MYARPCRCSSSRSGIGIDRSSWLGAAALEVVAVVVGHAEQLADHQRRDRQREVLDQICGRARRFPSRRAGRSTISTMRGSSRFIRRMVNSGVSMRRSRDVRAGRGRAGFRPARVACLLLGGLRHALHRETRRARVGEPLVVGQHGLDVVVPGDQVDLHAEGAGDSLHARRSPGSRRSSGVGSNALRRMCSGGSSALRSWFDATRGRRTPRSAC